MCFTQRIRPEDVIHLFNFDLSHASYCQVKDYSVLKHLFPHQTIREYKMNHNFVTVDFRSPRYVSETHILRSGCLHEAAMKTEDRKLQRKFAIEMFTWSHSCSQFEKHLVS